MTTPILDPTLQRVSSRDERPSDRLAARMDDLERLFGELLAIVKDLVETQTEFTGRRHGR